MKKYFLIIFAVVTCVSVNLFADPEPTEKGIYQTYVHHITHLTGDQYLFEIITVFAINDDTRKILWDSVSENKISGDLIEQWEKDEDGYMMRKDFFIIRPGDFDIILSEKAEDPNFKDNKEIDEDLYPHKELWTYKITLKGTFTLDDKEGDGENKFSMKVDHSKMNLNKFMAFENDDYLRPIITSRAYFAQYDAVINSYHPLKENSI